MSDSALFKTAVRLIERKFAPIPVPHKTKKPVLKGWQNLRLDAVSAAQHFNGAPSNLGILLGAPSGNLIDSDLDTPQAIAAASFFLPATPWITGRKSAPRSHWWYRSPSGLPAKAQITFDDPIDKSGPHKGRLLELRSNGQTLFLPSVHDEGEKLEKYGDLSLDPANVEAADLVKSVHRLAAAALLAKHWPGGSRHDAALALTGTLKTANWNQADALRFVEAVATAANDEQIKDRLKAVESTYAKDGAQTGATKLGELIDKRVVGAALSWLGIRPAKQIRIKQTPPYREFPINAIPMPISTFVTQASAALGCDPAFVALPSLAAIASCIGNTRVIYLGRDWTEVSVVWSLLVADSGTLKTPALNKATGHFYRIQKRLLDEFKIAIEQYELEMAQWKDAKAAAKKKDGDDPGDPPVRPVLPRVILGDVTVEKLAEVHEDNPRGTFVVRDEFSAWLGGLTRYRGKSGGSDLPNWLPMFNAGPLIVDRKTGERRTLFVPNAATSMTGGIQPGVMARVMTQDFLDAGGAARILLAMPPKKAKVWTDAEIDPAVAQAYHDLIDKLLALPFRVDDGEKKAFVVGMTAPAHAKWVEFYNEWAREQANAEGELCAALSKLEAYAARFALIHHVVSHVAVDTSDLEPVGVKSVEAGITLCKWFADEVRRVYSTLNETNEDRDARRLVEFIRNRGERITARLLQKSNSRKYPDSETARAALDVLVESNLGYWTPPEASPQGGHSAVWFVLHPRDTTDTTDTTRDDGEWDDGQGVRHYPPEQNKAPENTAENRGTVGTVGSAESENEETGTNGAEAVLSAGGGVASEMAHTLINQQADLPMVLAAVDESAVVGLPRRGNDRPRSPQAQGAHSVPRVRYCRWRLPRLRRGSRSSRSGRVMAGARRQADRGPQCRLRSGDSCQAGLRGRQSHRHDDRVADRICGRSNQAFACRLL
jgi:hypothetical protein